MLAVKRHQNVTGGVRPGLSSAISVLELAEKEFRGKELKQKAKVYLKSHRGREKSEPAGLHGLRK